MAYDREEVLKYHIGGKVAVALPKPLKTKDDLCLAYTPGVAHAVKAIAENKDAAWDVTAKRNLVTVVSDGTAILGLGDLGAAASVPVMEGKAVLFKAFADVPQGRQGHGAHRSAARHRRCDGPRPPVWWRQS